MFRGTFWKCQMTSMAEAYLLSITVGYAAIWTDRFETFSIVHGPAIVAAVV